MIRDLAMLKLTSKESEIDDRIDRLIEMMVDADIERLRNTAPAAAGAIHPR